MKKKKRKKLTIWSNLPVTTIYNSVYYNNSILINKYINNQSNYYCDTSFNLNLSICQLPLAINEHAPA